MLALAVGFPSSCEKLIVSIGCSGNISGDNGVGLLGSTLVSTAVVNRQVNWIRVLSRINDDLWLLDSIVRFGFSNRRLEQTATCSISTNSDVEKIVVLFLNIRRNRSFNHLVADFSKSLSEILCFLGQFFDLCSTVSRITPDLIEEELCDFISRQPYLSAAYGIQPSGMRKDVFLNHLMNETNFTYFSFKLVFLRHFIRGCGILLPSYVLVPEIIWWEWSILAQAVAGERRVVVWKAEALESLVFLSFGHKLLGGGLSHHSSSSSSYIITIMAFCFVVLSPCMQLPYTLASSSDINASIEEAWYSVVGLCFVGRNSLIHVNLKMSAL
ncbi:hypothetical protein Tco_1420569 [Tanacetum coccineum]